MQSLLMLLQFQNFRLSFVFLPVTVTPVHIIAITAFYSPIVMKISDNVIIWDQNHTECN